MAREKSCTWVLCMFSPRCDPIKVMHLAFCISVFSTSGGLEPYVRENPVSIGPLHKA
jgi:hypothetical protein